MKKAALLLIALILFTPLLFSAAPLPQELSIPIETARAAYEAGDYGKVIETLNNYTGQDHPVRHLLAGHAYLRQEKFEDAIKAYQKALEVDTEYRAAGIALAQTYSKMDKWDEVLRLCGTFIDPVTCNADEIVFFAQAAYHEKDFRLCSKLVDKAMLRFPVDKRLRKIDLFLLVANEAWRESSSAAMQLLKDTPNQPELWQNLSHAQLELKNQSTACAAIEAAWLLDPQNPDLLMQHLSAQLSANHPDTVLTIAEELLSDKRKNSTLKSMELVTLLIRAADYAADDKKLQSWFSMIPQNSLNEEIVISKARSDLRMGDREQARKALDILVKSGKATAMVYVWAASLAEESNDASQAEAMYRQAMQADNTQNRLATLRLARLLWQTKRPDEARSLIRAYLEKHPEDTAARSMSQIFQQR